MTADNRSEYGPGFPDTIYLILEIYNEGELAASNISGYWRAFTPSSMHERHSVPIHRDFLGKCEKYTDTLRIDDGGRPFKQREYHVEVYVQFNYSTLPQDQSQHYNATYAYDWQSKRLVKVQ